MKKNFRPKDYLSIVLGSFITAVGVAAFITPARIASGGVSGVAIILFHTLGYDVGTTILVLSVPLFIAGFLIFGRLYGFTSLLGTILLSAFVTIFGRLFGFAGFLDYSDSVDILLSAVFGGVLSGFGIGLVIKGGANTGGTDIIAQIISRYTPLSVGTALFFVDGLVILAGGFIFGLESALFAIVSVYTTSIAINFVLLRIGTRYAKTALIVSSQHTLISKRIIEELGHGGTLLQGTGIFTGTARPVLMTVIPNQKIGRLNTIVHESDPKAFMIIEEAFQVLGEGFSPMEQI